MGCQDEARRTSQLLWSEAALISQRFVFHCFSSAPCADLYLRWLWQQLWARLFQAQFSVYISFSVWTCTYNSSKFFANYQFEHVMGLSQSPRTICAESSIFALHCHGFCRQFSCDYGICSVSVPSLWGDGETEQAPKRLQGGIQTRKTQGAAWGLCVKKTQTCWNCHHFLMMCWEDQWPSTIPANLTRNLKVAMSNRKLSSKHAYIFDIRIQVGIRCNWWN